MYRPVRDSQNSPRSHSYSKQTSYFLLFGVILLFFLSVYEQASSDFRADRILRSLMRAESSDALEGEMGRVGKMRGEVDRKMDQLKGLIDQEQYLLVKIKDSHIQDNKEENQIPEISNFVQRLAIYQQLFNEKSEQFKRLTQNITSLKALKKENQQNIESGKAFKEKSQAIVAQLAQLSQKLDEVLKINGKWSERIEKRLQKQIEVSTSDEGEDQIQELPQYYSLPPLAKQILKPLPIELLKILYSSTAALHEESQLQSRQKFYKQRQYLAKHHKENPSFSLTKYNIQSGVERRNWQADIINHYSQMNEKYSLESITSEMGFCIIVPTYNNANNFRAELNLNSIFSQNYTNYKVVIIDDASQDQTATIIRKYLQYYQIPKQKCELLVNSVNKKALENIYLAIMNRCDGHQIVAIVDGDDELIGLNVLKVFNAMYTHQKLGVLYSNFYFYRHSAFEVRKGFNSEYSEYQKQNYRAVNQKFSHLISFKAELLREVKIQDLQYTNGKFYHVAYDFAMMYPLMELSCTHVKYLDEFQYLYSIGTGMNDYEVLEKDQKELASAILKKTPYPCSYKYDY